MRRSIARILLAGLVVGGLWFGGCSEDDGSSSAIDLNGVYRWSVTFTEVQCGSRNTTQNVIVQQSGDNVTFLIPADAGRTAPVSGAIKGANVHATGTYQNPPWALVLELDATAGGGGASLDGSMVFSWVDTSDNYRCVDKATFSAARI